MSWWDSLISAVTGVGTIIGTGTAIYGAVTGPEDVREAAATYESATIEERQRMDSLIELAQRLQEPNDPQSGYRNLLAWASGYTQGKSTAIDDPLMKPAWDQINSEYEQTRYMIGNTFRKQRRTVVDSATGGSRERMLTQLALDEAHALGAAERALESAVTKQNLQWTQENRTAARTILTGNPELIRNVISGGAYKADFTPVQTAGEGLSKTTQALVQLATDRAEKSSPGGTNAPEDIKQPAPDFASLTGPKAETAYSKQ